MILCCIRCRFFFLLNFPSSYFLVEKLRAFGETLNHLFALDRGCVVYVQKRTNEQEE